MSQTGKEIADTAVIDSDKAMNCGWRLTSKGLNKEAAICDSKINVIFSLSLFLFLHRVAFLESAIVRYLWSTWVRGL